jgi:signal transduction histidine kinase
VAEGEEPPGLWSVLAVDDEPQNQRAVRRALADECRVVTAGGGEEALAALGREPFALCVVDHRMPGMTGAELLARVAQAHPEMIRVVLTGYADVDMLVGAINSGHVYHVLCKPWDTRELRLVVRRGLERFAAERERRRLQRELEVACASARREAAQKSRLLVLAAHELGTPLHILVNAIALIESAELPPAAAGWVESAQRATSWLVRGVTQINTASRIRERRLLLRRRPTSLGALVDGLLDELSAAARDRRLRLSFPRRAPVERALVDPEWVRLALWNLLTNAIRFTPDGGAVAVEMEATHAEVVFIVRDTGIGIAAEVADEIFEPFSAAAGDVLLHGSGLFSFGARGLGLGLATVKGIAEAHGGSVDVCSAAGAGSSFRLRLPLGDTACAGTAGVDRG